MKVKYYVTTPLYYVNAKPHIGHSYTTVAADALARAKRLLGYDVFFLTGTDEHGQKVAKASQEAGLSPKEFTDKFAGLFKDLWKLLDVEFDDFIRTTQERHTKAVQHVWKELEKIGQIKREKYEGWYCTTCEAFWPYREIGDQAGPEKNCPQCQKSLEEIHEDNYFFTISQHQAWLIDYIEKNPACILPESRRNETLSFLKHNPLHDLCISRPKSRLKWGIETPISPDHVTYVWFDALINYISACGYPERGGKLKQYWPADVHLIGKDILRPHTVYWPIMLHALGIEPPRMVFAHGWWMMDQAKMSKSLGNVVNPIDVVNEYGVDAYRYFLLREVPFGQDGSYSDEAIELRYNVDLANDLGNLLHRTLSMLEKYSDGVIQAQGAKDADHELRRGVVGLPKKMEKALDRMAFSDCLQIIWSLIRQANKFIEEQAPWTLKKQDKTEELQMVLVSLCESLRVITQAVWPFIPRAASKIWQQLGLPPEELVSESFVKLEWNYFNKDVKTQKGNPVFPRREEAKK